MAAPVRMCRVCRQRGEKSGLRRWVIQDGRLVADEAQRLPGRGYYTDSPTCIEKLPKVLKIVSKE
jgi:predicted RNA-binding protein YlxR (DUF448 family)